MWYTFRNGYDCLNYKIKKHKENSYLKEYLSILKYKLSVKTTLSKRTFPTIYHKKIITIKRSQQYKRRKRNHKNKQ